MRDVAILGVGRTPVREHWELSVRDLLQDAGRAALDDCGRDRVDAVFVGNMTGGTLNQQLHLGALAVDALGLWGVEAMRFEAACGSAGSAMRQGIMAVASGVMDARGLGELMQLRQRGVGDQVREDGAVGGPARRVDQDGHAQPATSWR